LGQHTLVVDVKEVIVGLDLELGTALALGKHGQDELPDFTVGKESTRSSHIPFAVRAAESWGRRLARADCRGTSIMFLDSLLIVDFTLT